MLGLLIVDSAHDCTVAAHPAGPCGTLPRVPHDNCLICFLQIGLAAAVFAVRHKKPLRRRRYAAAADVKLSRFAGHDVT